MELNTVGLLKRLEEKFGVDATPSLTEVVEAIETFAKADAETKRMNDLVLLASRICVTAHSGQVDKHGKDYYLHPYRVAATAYYLAPEHLKVKAQIVGFLHDVVEDTTLTLNDLRIAKFDEDIVASVDAMTKRDGEKLDDYIKRVGADPVARYVKRADVKDNTDPSRTRLLNEATRARLTIKYQRTLELLDQATS